MYDSDGDIVELNVHNKFLTDHDYLDTKNPNPNQSLQSLRKTLASKNSELSKLKKKNTLLKNKNDSLMSGNLPKTVQNKAVEMVLNGQFTGKQIEQFCKPKKTEGTVYTLGQ